MNLETYFQMLDKVNKYADNEFNFSQIYNVNFYRLLNKARPKGSYVINKYSGVV